MMKLLTVLLMVIGIASNVRGADADFRQAKWGMTQAQVIATESKQPDAVRESNGETIVQYDSVSVANLDSRLIYIFANDKLVRAKYVIHPSHADLNDFIADFRAVDPVLRDTWGKPSYERTFWENDPFQDEGVNYLEQDRALPLDILPSDKFAGIEISLGYLKLYSQWTQPRTKLVHALTGAEHRITHQIEYRSVELTDLENTVIEQSLPGR